MTRVGVRSDEAHKYPNSKPPYRSCLGPASIAHSGIGPEVTMIRAHVQGPSWHRPRSDNDPCRGAQR